MSFNICKFLLIAILFVSVFGDKGCLAAEESASIFDKCQKCSRISDNAERLDCYDKISGRRSEELPIAGSDPQSLIEAEGTKPGILSSKWQLEDSSRRKNFAIMPHRQNYILPVTYNYHQENQTYESANPGTKIQNEEVKYQLSLKVKLWEDVLGKDMDLWFGYTQLSLWQFYNSEFSSPFRETNYEPEILLNYRTNMDLFGLIQNRFVQVGFNHQSNGRGEPLSRSWNRLVANFGFERNDFNLVLKTWLRIPESNDNDDNSDITSYLGHGELWMDSIWKDCHLGIMLRNNLQFNDNRGAMQFEVSFPLIKHINGYIQYFVGYGESLIDYNHYTNRIGLGFMLKEW